LGLSEVSTKLAILLNDDVHDLSIKDVKNTISWLYSDDKVAAVGALLTSNKKVINHLGIACLNNVWDNLLEGTHLNRFNPLMIYPRQVSAVTAAYVGLNVKKFREIGEFDENFINQFDDVDLMLRFNLKGFKVIFDPNIKLIHQKTSTMKNSDILDNLPYFNSKWGETNRDNFYSSFIESYFS
jgi:GT2 family glycosyltransferase